MKKTLVECITFLSPVAGLLGCASVAPSEPENMSSTQHAIQVSVDTTWKNKYIAAPGFTVNDHPVQQGSITLTSERLPHWFATLWGNYSFRDDEWSEVDLSLGHDSPLSDHVGLSVTASHYHFDFGSVGIPNAQNLNATLYTTDLPVDAYVSIDHIFGRESGHGQYYTLGTSTSFDLDDRFHLSLEGKVLYNDHYFTDAHGFSVGSAGFALYADLSKHWTLSAGYVHQFPLDEETFGGAFQEEEIVSIGIAH